MIYNCMKKNRFDLSLMILSLAFPPEARVLMKVPRCLDIHILNNNNLEKEINILSLGLHERSLKIDLYETSYDLEFE